MFACLAGACPYCQPSNLAGCLPESTAALEACHAFQAMPQPTYPMRLLSAATFLLLSPVHLPCCRASWRASRA